MVAWVLGEERRQVLAKDSKSVVEEAVGRALGLCKEQRGGRQAQAMRRAGRKRS